MFDPIPDVLLIPVCLLLAVIYAAVGVFMLRNPRAERSEPPEGQ